MKRPIVPLLALVALAALVRAQMAAGTYLINQDSPGYLQPARVLRESGVRAALAWPGAPHPAYPMLIAGLSSAIGDDERAGIIIAVAFGAMAVVPVWAAGCAFSASAGWAAALIYAVHTAFTDSQSEVMTEGMAHFFIATALAGFAWWIARGSWRGLAVAGAATLLTWTVRLDGAVLAAVLPATALLLPLWRRPWRRFAWGAPALIGVMLIVALPVAALFMTIWGKTITPRPPRKLTFSTDDTSVEGRPSKFVQMKTEYGPVLGTARYLVHILGIAFVPVNLLLLVAGVIVAARRPELRPALSMGVVAIFALGILIAGMIDYNYRMGPRYFAVAVLASMPIVGIGTAWIVRSAQAIPGILLLVVMVAVNLAPSIASYRRFDHGSERQAGRFLAARREPDARVYWVGMDRRFYWYCGESSRPAFADVDDLTQQVADGRIQAIGFLECDPMPPEIRTLIERDDLFGKPWIFPDPPVAGVHPARVYPVRGTPLAAP